MPGLVWPSRVAGAGQRIPGKRRGKQALTMAPCVRRILSVARGVYDSKARTTSRVLSAAELHPRKVDRTQNKEISPCSRRAPLAPTAASYVTEYATTSFTVMSPGGYEFES